MKFFLLAFPPSVLKIFTDSTSQIWIFNFNGTSNHNYAGYLLEMYCLLKYEASEDLKNAILNNWLVNLSGDPGKWIEGDLLQEHYNR
jgi:hypothetical protein